MAFDRDGYWHVVASTIALLPPACIAFFLRCYVKIHLVHAFTLEDWLMLVSLLLFIAYNALIIVMAQNGFGQHMDVLDPDQVTMVAQLFWVSEMLYILVTIFASLSVAFLLNRLSVRRVQSLIVRIGAAFNTLCGAAFLFTVIFQCSPIVFYWDKSIAGACRSREVVVDLAYASAAINAAGDCLYSLLPIWMLWKIQMERKAKIWVCIVLGLGLLTAIAGTARIRYIEEYAMPDDFSYSTTSIAITSNLECGFGIIAASLATLRPLIRSIRSKLPGRRCHCNCPSCSNRNHACCQNNFGPPMSAMTDTTISQEEGTSKVMWPVDRTNSTVKPNPSLVGNNNTQSPCCLSATHTSPSRPSKRNPDHPDQLPDFAPLTTPSPSRRPRTPASPISLPRRSPPPKSTPSPTTVPKSRNPSPTDTSSHHTSTNADADSNSNSNSTSSFNIATDAKEWEAACMAARERAKLWSEEASKRREEMIAAGEVEEDKPFRERGVSYQHESDDIELGFDLGSWNPALRPIDDSKEKEREKR